MAFGINAAFLVLEVVGGVVSGSLALLADAGHMLTDVAALVLAIVVTGLAERPPTPRMTYGLLRAEVLGAFVNGATLMVVVGLIFVEAWRRFSEPAAVTVPVMIGVAVLGLAANLVSVAILYRDREKNVNLRGAFLHMAADTLGSVGVIVAGLVIMITGWRYADPLASVCIGLLILWGSWGLMSETMGILLEATPRDVDYDEVREALLAIDHITDVHDLHIWTITSGIPSLSAHVTLEPRCSDSTHWKVCLRGAQDMLRERFGIVHSTLQFEPDDYVRDDRIV